MKNSTVLIRASSCVGVAAMAVSAALSPIGAIAEPVKLKTPTVVKEVMEDRDSSWNEMADASVGELLSFRVQGTLPERLDMYDTYYYSFVDRCSEAISVDSGTIKVSLVAGDDEPVDVTDKFAVSFEDNVIRASCDDIKVAFSDLSDDSYFLLTYSATLNNLATTGFSNTNDNFCHVEHTKQKVVDSSLLVAPVGAVADGVGIGDVNPDIASTPDAKASVATYAVDLTKIAGDNGKTLSGAKFTIEDESGKYLGEDGYWGSKDSAKVFETDKDGKLAFSGLDTGKYKLHETAAPSGYSALDNVELTITGDVESASKKLSADAKNADITGLNASSGVIEVKISDPSSDGSKSESKPTTSPTSSKTSSALGGGGSSGGSSAPLSKTGDMLLSAAPFLAVGAVIVCSGVVIRRKSSDKN